MVRFLFHFVKYSVLQTWKRTGEWKKCFSFCVWMICFMCCLLYGMWCVFAVHLVCVRIMCASRRSLGSFLRAVSFGAMFQTGSPTAGSDREGGRRGGVGILRKHGLKRPWWWNRQGNRLASKRSTTTAEKAAAASHSQLLCSPWCWTRSVSVKHLMVAVPYTTPHVKICRA